MDAHHPSSRLETGMIAALIVLRAGMGIVVGLCIIIEEFWDQDGYVGGGSCHSLGSWISFDVIIVVRHLQKHTTTDAPSLLS